MKKTIIISLGSNAISQVKLAAVAQGIAKLDYPFAAKITRTSTVAEKKAALQAVKPVISEIKLGKEVRDEKMDNGSLYIKFDHEIQEGSDLNERRMLGVVKAAVLDKLPAAYGIFMSTGEDLPERLDPKSVETYKVDGYNATLVEADGTATPEVPAVGTETGAPAGTETTAAAEAETQTETTEGQN